MSSSGNQNCGIWLHGEMRTIPELVARTRKAHLAACLVQVGRAFSSSTNQSFRSFISQYVATRSVAVSLRNAAENAVYRLLQIEVDQVFSSDSVRMSTMVDATPAADAGF